MKEQPKVALVLSGGAALGFAHVGVIEELIENNINIDLVVGASMGAIVGAGFASGVKIDDMKQASKNMRLTKMFDINFKKGGLFSGRRLTTLLKQIYKVKLIEDMPIEFACVAVDIVSGQVCALKKGDLVTAVRASMSIPGMFLPVKCENRLLIDGGVLNNFPDDIAKEMGADIVIGVDVIKNYSYCHTHAKSMVDSVMNAFCLVNKKMEEVLPNHTDVLIEPKQSEVFQMSFKKDLIMKSIEAGRLACREKIEEIKKIINDKKN